MTTLGSILCPGPERVKAHGGLDGPAIPDRFVAGIGGCSAQLSTLEKLLGSKLLALSARKKRHSARVNVGGATFTLAAGQSRRFTVPLNATGTRLLHRFGKLPVTLTVSLSNTNPPTVVQTRTTIKRKGPRRRRHH